MGSISWYILDFTIELLFQTWILLKYSVEIKCSVSCALMNLISIIYQT